MANTDMTEGITEQIFPTESENFCENFDQDSYLKDLKLEKFDGRTNTFSEWLSHFKLISQLKHYPAEAKPLLLLASLKGEPLALSANLTEYETSTFTKCVAALRLRLGDNKTEKDFEIKANSRKRLSNENPQTFANVLNDFFRKAFPSMEPDSLNRLVLTQFIRGSGNSDLQFSYDTEKILSLADAIRFLVALDKKAENAQATITPVVKAVTSSMSSILPTTATLKESDTSDHVHFTPSQNFSRPTLRREPSASSHSVCQLCHKTGHVATTCFKFLAMQDQLQGISFNTPMNMTHSTQHQRPLFHHPNRPSFRNGNNLNEYRSHPGRNMRSHIHNAPNPTNRFQSPR